MEAGTGQIVWTPVVQRLVEAADFGLDTTPDRRQMIAELTADEDFPLIKLDVRRRGGQPVIKGRNVRASTICQSYSDRHHGTRVTSGGAGPDRE